MVGTLPTYTEDQIKGATENRNYAILLDVSASMQTSDSMNGDTRYDFAREIIGGIASVSAKFDPDGIDVFTFAGAGDFHHYPNVTPATVKSAIPPTANGGGTKLGAAMEQVFNHFGAFGKMERPLTIIVLSDGDTQDKDVLEKVIVRAAKESEGESVAIGFWQIGQDPDVEATLKFLDDEIPAKHGVSDIVDTKGQDEVIAAFGNIAVLLTAAVLD